MKNIVVPVDFSAQSTKLLAEAAKFAQLMGGHIDILHVVSADLGYAVGDAGFQYIPELENTVVREDEKQLLQYQNQLKEQGISAQTQLLHGNAAESVLAFAQERHSDFLVIGSHGRSNFYDLFVGSLTKELTQKSTIPVLVIPIH